MKKIISILIIAFVSVNLFAQTNMIIRTTDGNTHSYSISIVDSVYYEEELPNCGTVIDYDGNEYATITIDTLCWMAENLKVTHYPNGDAIPNVTGDTDWANLTDDNTSDAYCYYNNNANNEADTYGALYTYAAAIGDNWARDLVNNQGVCPDGWHLPTDAEWTTLTNYLGGENIAGGKMKEIDTTYWDSPNEGADNSSGFTALPNGVRYNNNGTFDYMGGSGVWWSATEENSDNAYYRNLNYNSAGVDHYYSSKSYGFAVRCVRD